MEILGKPKTNSSFFSLLSKMFVSGAAEGVCVFSAVWSVLSMFMLISKML